ncbi:MAG TPA: hypothetical protein VMD76_09620 [Candidatus Sulfotelmatobacter sp.]|nr:hypothetical protein [Candidatus Sulfotelmatobacter sp.]
MASLSQSVPARVRVYDRKGLLDEYFYFAMSLLFAVIVVTGFRITINQNLFHPAIPRPWLLWVHASAFASWIAFYIFQASLVRTHHVKIHRTLGWVGAGLGTLMVPLGCITAVVMTRFDTVQLHQSDPAFLSVPFFDMIAFGTLFGLAIYWRGKPELHKRLLFIATCCLLDAPFGRSDFIFFHYLFYPCLDLVIFLGVVRDLMVNRRVHPVYRYALLFLIPGQAFTVYLWHFNPAWWRGATHAILS